MRNLFTKLLRIVLPVLAFIGLAKIADKTLAGKAPGYDEFIAPTAKGKALLWFIAVFAAANIVYHFIIRKLRLKL